MDVKSIKEEMQFVTGQITDDLDYLLYLLLKDGTRKKKDSIIENKIAEPEKSKYSEESLNDWFSNL